jgi:hypothetical protein
MRSAFRFVRPAMCLGLVTFIACSKSESAQPTTADTRKNAPVALIAQQIPKPDGPLLDALQSADFDVQATRGCGEPSDPLVTSATISVEYHALQGFPDQKSLPPQVMPFGDALNVLACASSFGRGTRLSRALQVLDKLAKQKGEESESFLKSLKIDKTGMTTMQADSATLSSADCCVHSSSSWTGRTPEGDWYVHFELEVGASYDYVTKRLDPQTWSELGGFHIKRLDSTCSEAETDLKCSGEDSVDENVGETWSDAVLEHFEFADKDFLSFCNVLSFCAEKKEKKYKLKYNLCRSIHATRSGKSFDANTRNKPPLLEDCGYTFAQDKGPKSTTVTGAKVIKFDPELCVSADCSDPVIAASLNALVGATRVAVCVGNTEVDSCSAPNTEDDSLARAKSELCGSCNP